MERRSKGAAAARVFYTVTRLLVLDLPVSSASARRFDSR